MANQKVDLSKPFGLVYGHESGAKYEQDGKLYFGSGDLVPSGKPTKVEKEPEPEKEADPELDALKAKAKELGIKSPHLFKAEALSLKIQEAELAALAASNPNPAE